MNSQEIFKLIKNIETGLDLEKFKLNGIDIWPQIRFNLITRLNAEIKNSNPNNYNYVRRLWFKLVLFPVILMELVKLYLKDNKNNDSSNTKRDLFFLTDSSSRRIKINELWYDVFIDPIIDYYSSKNYSHVTFETSQKFFLKYPRYRKTKLLTGTMLIYYIRSILFFYQIRNNANFEYSYREYREILTEFGLRNHILSLRTIKLDASYVYQLSKYFMIKLNRIKPKYVFMVPYSGYSGKALCYACKKLSIKTIDIQHGVQGDYHPAYSSFSNVPLTGFNVMPNIFLTWSKTESQNINKWAIDTKNTHAVAVGNIMQQNFMKESIVSRYYDVLFKDLFKTVKNKIKILITLQYDHYFPEVISNLLNTSPESYFYLIRFHPSTTLKEIKDVNNTLNKITKKNYEFNNASHLPIFSLLRNIDLHITQYSSVVIEAASFNIKSIVIDDIGKATYEDYISKGLAFYCKNEIQMISLIEKLTKHEDKKILIKHKKDNNSSNMVLDDILLY